MFSLSVFYFKSCPVIRTRNFYIFWNRCVPLFVGRSWKSRAIFRSLNGHKLCIFWPLPDWNALPRREIGRVRRHKENERCVPQERGIWCILLDNSLISFPCAHVRVDCFLRAAMASRWRSMIAKDRKSHRWIWARFCWASPLLTTGWPLRFPNAWALFGICLFFLYFFVAKQALGHSKCEQRSALNTSKALSLYFELLNCRRDGNCDFLNASWSWSSYI